jgi:hypothetical protein
MRTNLYRIDIRFRAGRMLVSVEGAPGPEASRHLRELCEAAERCDINVVVTKPSSIPAAAPVERAQQQ